MFCRTGAHRDFSSPAPTSQPVFVSVATRLVAANIGSHEPSNFAVKTELMKLQKKKKTFQNSQAIFLTKQTRDGKAMVARNLTPL